MPDDRLGLEARRKAVGEPLLPAAATFRESLDEVLRLLLPLRVTDQCLDDLCVQRPAVLASRRSERLERVRWDIADVNVRHALDDIHLIPQIDGFRKMSGTDGEARVYR